MATTGVLRPLETVLDGIPALAVKDAEAQRLKQGQTVLLRARTLSIAELQSRHLGAESPWDFAASSRTHSSRSAC